MAVGPFWWVPTGALFALVRAAWAYNGCQQVLFLLTFAGFAGRWTLMKVKNVFVHWGCKPPSFANKCLACDGL
jgi:hypothetical protein